MLKDKEVVTWISASALSRHRHQTAFAVTRGEWMRGWDPVELLVELLCCSSVMDAGVDEGLGPHIICHGRIIFIIRLFPRNFLTVLVPSIKFREKFAIPGFPLLPSWLFVSTRELQCVNL